MQVIERRMERDIVFYYYAKENEREYFATKKTLTISDENMSKEYAISNPFLICEKNNIGYISTEDHLLYKIDPILDKVELVASDVNSDYGLILLDGGTVAYCSHEERIGTSFHLIKGNKNVLLEENIIPLRPLMTNGREACLICRQNEKVALLQYNSENDEYSSTNFSMFDNSCDFDSFSWGFETQKWISSLWEGEGKRIKIVDCAKKSIRDFSYSVPIYQIDLIGNGMFMILVTQGEIVITDTALFRCLKRIPTNQLFIPTIYANFHEDSFLCQDGNFLRYFEIIDDAR